MYSCSFQFIDEIVKGNVLEVVVFNGMVGNDGSKSMLFNFDLVFCYVFYVNVFLKGYYLFYWVVDCGIQYGFVFLNIILFIKNGNL